MLVSLSVFRSLMVPSSSLTRVHLSLAIDVGEECIAFLLSPRAANDVQGAVEVQSFLAFFLGLAAPTSG
jgi:hypothetical protein